MKKRLLYSSTIILACAIGIFVGWNYRVWYTSKLPSKVTETRENTNEFHFINPLLLVDVPRAAPEFGPLQATLKADIASVKANGDASSVSVYFRDLNSGHWTGVDEDKVYDPSSMLKVAVMMGYLRRADLDPSILLKKLPYVATVDPGQNYKPEHPLTTGSYTILNLIQAMIIDSDNTALNVLYDNDREAFIDVLKALQIPPPPSSDTLDFMSPKMYGGLFRTLYSGTYLSKERSEQVLELMTYTTFKNGLVAGVPTDTIVAHKFGEHTTTNALGTVEERQLHDCGIIYYPGHPYLLCVMTKGHDFPKLESVISNISRIVYQKVSADNPK